MSYYNSTDLRLMGWKSVGENVLVSIKASIYNCDKISINSNSRVDDYAILSAGKEGIEIGNYCHIGCHVTLIGAAKITLEDYVSIAAHSAMFSSTDDFSGSHLAGATIPSEYRDVINAEVRIGKFVTIGSNCVILPGVTIGENSAIGAMSLVRYTLKGGFIYAGNPIQEITIRRGHVFSLGEKLEAERYKTPSAE